MAYALLVSTEFLEEEHTLYGSGLAKFYFGVIFKTGAKRKKKGVGTCLRTPVCIITLL